MRRIAVLGFFAMGTLAWPCITLPGAGGGPVKVAWETATIVWDPATKTEHFIRSAAFNSDGKPMGFLVPTPTPPKLKALDPFSVSWGLGAFQREIAPKVVVRKRPVYRLSPTWDFFPSSRSATKTAQTALAGQMRGGVDVLSQGQVGSYQTAVLRADDSQALLAWLKTNKFEVDARLTEWLDPYVSKGWAITAFRFAPVAPQFVTEPIRLSFKTDRPFYPYREPRDTRTGAQRSLRVYFVSPERVEGQLENGAWGTRAEHSGPLHIRTVYDVAAGFELPQGLFQGRRLTSFLDATASRPPSELYFDRAADQSKVALPPVVRVEEDPVYIPKGSAASALAFGVLGAALIRRRRKR
jgi:hypothetical protein